MQESGEARLGSEETGTTKDETPYFPRNDLNRSVGRPSVGGNSLPARSAGWGRLGNPLAANQISRPWAVSTIISRTSWLEMEPMNSLVSPSATGSTVSELSVIRCNASSTSSSE